jgi:hypothetical protein
LTLIGSGTIALVREILAYERNMGR